MPRTDRFKIWGAPSRGELTVTRGRAETPSRSLRFSASQVCAHALPSRWQRRRASFKAAASSTAWVPGRRAPSCPPPDAFFDVEHADAFGGVELVAAEGEKVQIQPLQVQGVFGEALDGVHVDQELREFPFQGGDQGLVGEDGADLVVDHQKGDEEGVRIHRFQEILHGEMTVGAGLDPLYGVAQLFQWEAAFATEECSTAVVIKVLPFRG